MSLEIAVAIGGFFVTGTAAALALFMGSRDPDPRAKAPDRRPGDGRPRERRLAAPTQVKVVVGEADMYM